MIRYLLLGFTFVLAHCIIFTESVNAEDGEGNASGDAPGNCTFINALDGELSVNQQGTILSSNFNETPASVEIDCSADATLTISKPVRSGGNGATQFLSTDLYAKATAKLFSIEENQDLPDINIDSDNQVGGSIPGNSLGTIKINMEARDSEKILPGEYKFTVTITATP